jgi:threonine/homoserine/homoserine lactone efflux protein
MTSTRVEALYATSFIIVGVLFLLLGMAFSYGAVTVTGEAPQWFKDMATSGPLHLALGVMMILFGVLSIIRPEWIFRPRGARKEREGV